MFTFLSSSVLYHSAYASAPSAYGVPTSPVPPVMSKIPPILTVLKSPSPLLSLLDSDESPPSLLDEASSEPPPPHAASTSAANKPNSKVRRLFLFRLITTFSFSKNIFILREPLFCIFAVPCQLVGKWP